MRFRAAGHNVLIQVDNTANRDAGYGKTTLIEVPSNMRKEIAFSGTVLAVGKKTNGVVPGDYVIIGTYRRYSFDLAERPDIEYALVLGEDIEMVLPDGAPRHLDVVPRGAREFAEVG